MDATCSFLLRCPFPLPLFVFPMLDHSLVKILFGKLLNRLGVLGRNMCRVRDSSILVIGVDKLLGYLSINVRRISQYIAESWTDLLSKTLDILSRKLMLVFVDDIADVWEELRCASAIAISIYFFEKTHTAFS